MAEKKLRYSENVKGSFYVDETCTSCGTCMSIAPYNFKFTVGDKHAYVYKQPDGEAELQLCLLAMQDCPANAIGDNG